MKNEVNQMKELYIAPEAEIVYFAPFEKLAYDESWRTGEISGGDIFIPETGGSGDGEMDP